MASAYIPRVTVWRRMFLVGLFLLSLLVGLGLSRAFILLVPVVMLGVTFGIIYGAVRLAIRHERPSETRDAGLYRP